MSKPYSYLSEKSYILKKRNLLNNLDLEDKSILNNYNYYNLINAYKEPFLKTRTSNNQEEYKNHVKLSHLESLSTFDIKMRGLFLTNILQIEENIKNILIDSFYLINNSLSDCLEVESEYLHKKYFNLDNIYSTNNFDRNTSRFYCEFNNIPSPRFNYTIDRKTIYYDFVANAYREINKQKRDRNKKNKNNSIKSYIEKHDIVPLWILVNNGKATLF